VTDAEARALIATGHLAAGAAQTWADLGCGDGAFTRALASCLPAGSVVHAMDQDARALRRIPATVGAVRITTHAGDFTRTPWPFADLDGILMANSLHYVREQPAFIHTCLAQMRRRWFLVVEYDTDRPNAWVPYPLSRARAKLVFAGAGLDDVRLLGTQPSRFRSASLYGVLIRSMS
jgi:trans-aconitate methyltransferase